uniref:X-box-binding protein 1 n=1 Tax=Romanomermis culicivorax TaxID=13658 RepID=A0A915J0H2_ROMCU
MSSSHSVNSKSRVIIITLPLIKRSGDPASSDVVSQNATKVSNSVVPTTRKRFSDDVKQEEPFSGFDPGPKFSTTHGGLGYHIDSALRNHLVIRKRQKLTHLTPQEKLNRRKFKNRLAAHLARERRKKFMFDLERRYRRLKYEHQELKARNMQIKQDIDRLNIENDMIKKQLSETTTLPRLQSSSTIDETSTADVTSSTPLASSSSALAENFGSAVFINEPRQQGRVFRGNGSPATSLTAWLLTLTMMASKTTTTSRNDFYEQSFDNVQQILERWALTSQKHQRWAAVVLEKLKSKTWSKEDKKAMVAKLLTYVQRRLLDNGTEKNIG